MDVVRAHDVHQQRDRAIRVVVRSPPAHVDRADAGVRHPAGMLLEDLRRCRVIRAEQRHAGRRKIGWWIPFPLFPSAPMASVPYHCGSTNTKCPADPGALVEGSRGASERRRRLRERRSAPRPPARAALHERARSATACPHAFEHLAELLDFLAVEAQLPSRCACSLRW